ncbi:unnamed protein product [Ixodes pacificus]
MPGKSFSCPASRACALASTTLRACTGALRTGVRKTRPAVPILLATIVPTLRITCLRIGTLFITGQRVRRRLFKSTESTRNWVGTNAQGCLRLLPHLFRLTFTSSFF